MSLSKKPRTADNFNVLASWVQQTNHFISETQERPLDNNTSRYLSTIEELIHPDKNDARTQGSSSGTQDPTLYNDWQTGAPTSSHPENAPSDTSGGQTWHPGVKTLLTEYYKLLESAPSGNPFSSATQYRPSFMSNVWNWMTFEIPRSFRFGNVSRKVYNAVHRISTASEIGIIAILLVWLQSLRFAWSLGVHPLFMIFIAVAGISILTMSEAKMKAKNGKGKESMRLTNLALNKTTPNEGSTRAFKSCKEMGRKTHPLSSVRWSSNLPRPSELKIGSESPSISKLAPPFSTKEATIVESVLSLRRAIKGSGTLDAPPNSGNVLRWAKESIQEFCDIVGISLINDSEPSITAIQAKIEELQDVLGS